MKIYLVGGAVRDKLLGLPIKERDWVVIGATVEEMVAQGFQPVGKDFPVFLHPKTHEEYTLARTERKTGRGYKGFTFYTSPDLTLEEDLKRRDLTINALAEDPQTGAIVDPYHGRQDLEHKILRHVSEAFQEDPVRILRLARFAARFPDFSVHPDTLKFMQNMVHAGEIHALVAERVWQECKKALMCTQPIQFFSTLHACGALAILFPYFIWNSRAQDALKAATDLSSLAPIRLAATLHQLTEADAQAFIQQYRPSKPYADLILLVIRYLSPYEDSLKADASSLLQLITQLDGLRRPDRLPAFALACQASSPTTISTQHLDHVEASIQVIKQVSIPEAIKRLPGPQLADQLKILRLQALHDYARHLT